MVALMAFYAITHIPPLQQRFFFEEEWDPAMGLRGVNTAGRNIIWPAVFVNALEKPLIGHGLGTARVVTAELFVGKKDVTEYHPHNEYLQAFHDLGLVGLAMIVAAWTMVLGAQWAMWEDAKTPLLAKWGLLGTLAPGIVLASSLTDNTLHYPMVIAPTVMLVSIANVLDRSQAT
jgi:O-antigen ligase